MAARLFWLMPLVPQIKECLLSTKATDGPAAGIDPINQSIKGPFKGPLTKPHTGTMRSHIPAQPQRQRAANPASRSTAGFLGAALNESRQHLACATHSMRYYQAPVHLARHLEPLPQPSIQDVTIGGGIGMYVYMYKDSAAPAPANARTRAHRPVAPRQSFGVSQTPHTPRLVRRQAFHTDHHR